MRVIDSPETHYFEYVIYGVHVNPPSNILYSARGKGYKSSVVKKFNGDEINEHTDELTFLKFKLPAGLVLVSFSYIDDDVLAFEQEALRPGVKEVVPSPDGQEMMLYIKHSDGTASRTTVPTEPLVRPLYGPDGQPYGTPRQ